MKERNLISSLMGQRTGKYCLDLEITGNLKLIVLIIELKRCFPVFKRVKEVYQCRWLDVLDPKSVIIPWGLQFLSSRICFFFICRRVPPDNLIFLS